MAAPDRSRTAGKPNSSARDRKPKKKKNVVHAGQRAVLNGKPVVADGQGNWRPVGGRDRTPVGSYKPGKDRTAKPSRGANAAYTSEKIKKNRISSEGKAKAVANNLSTRTKPTPKPTPKPTTTKPKPTVTKPKPTQPKNAGAGNGAPRPAEVKPATKSSQRLSDTMSGKRGLAAKGPHIKSDRLRDALKSVKKYKPKK